MPLKSKKYFLPILIIIFGLLFNGTGMHQHALADDPLIASVSISPNPASLNGCETLALAIWVNNVSGLYGADIQLTFDPSILEVQDDDPLRNGVQVQNGGFLAPDFVLFNYADNSNGTIRYTITQLNPTQEVSGSGKLIIVHLKAKGNGSSAVHFSKVELANRDAGNIPATGQDGTVTTNPPSSPTLTISKLNSSDARLSWSSIGGIAEYHLYRGTTPYFAPQDPAYQTLSGTQYDDSGVLGDYTTNYFYVVKAVCPNGAVSAASNRVGEFDFGLVRNAANTIALPLIDPSLQTADDLGAATGSSKVSEWVPETSSFRTRLVHLIGPNFSLQTGHGYFVRTNSSLTPTVFTMVGGVPEAGAITFPIYRAASCRLNLLSLPLDHPELNTALKIATSIGGVPKISEWVASTGSFRTYLVGVGPINFGTKIGYPYWPCADNSGSSLSWP